MRKKVLKSNLMQNVGLVAAVVCFLAFGFAPIVESAQTSKKPTPTPTKKKSTPTPLKKKVTPTPTPAKKSNSTTAKAKSAPILTPAKKTTSTSVKPKSTPTPTKPKTATETTAVSSAQYISRVTAARVRLTANASSTEVRKVKLGSLVNVLGKTGTDWYKVEIPAIPKNVVGYMSAQVLSQYDGANRDEIYQKLAERNYKPEMSFSDGSEVFEFLSRAQLEVKSNKLASEFGLKSLLALRAALKGIGDKDKTNPYKNFLVANEKNVIFSEPSGEWYVRTEKFWDLQKKYANSPNAEEIAWIAATNPVAGECEGYVNCYLFVQRESNVKYLELYPSGKYALDALKNVQNLLDPIISDLVDKQIYTGPSDVSDKAEFYRFINEIRTIVSKFTLDESAKQAVIQQLNQIAEGYK